MKTALVHEWLVTIGGAEKVLEKVYEVFPSNIYTLVCDRDKIQNFKEHEIITSFLQKFPKGVSKYKWYLPFFPLAIEQFDLSSYDLILSSSHCAAKGVLTHPEQLHICYCHTPMRYAWDLYHQYLKEENLEKGLKGKLVKAILHYLRFWDLSTSNRVDHFIANSNFVSRRIKKIYNRDSKVIYPPVDTEYFSLENKKDDYYLAASRLVSYKKIDLIVEAFASMPEKKLIVIGDGPEMKKIKSKATANIQILGHVKGDELKLMLQKAQAFIFAAVEDFGILPVEAESCGTPVIALKQGGAKETVIENETGLFFETQEVKAIIDAVKDFEKKQDLFDPKVIRRHAEKFSAEIFKEEYKNFVMKKYNEFRSI